MSDQGECTPSGHRASQVGGRLVLTTDRRIGASPLRLEGAGGAVGADLDERIETLRAAIRSGKASAPASAAPRYHARDEDPLRPEEVGDDEDVRDLVARSVRELLPSALDDEIVAEKIRLIVRREVARALAARRRG